MSETIKHAISSPEYCAQMRGFRHGAGGQPMDPDQALKEYEKGYNDGQAMRRKYSDILCKQMNLENSSIVLR